MITTYSPARLRVLIACYLRQEPPMPNDAPVQSETISEFLDLGVIQPGDDPQFSGEWMTTPLGDAWVRALLKTPLPKATFVDEHGNVL